MLTLIATADASIDRVNVDEVCETPPRAPKARQNA
jgi:hypothetical protein